MATGHLTAGNATLHVDTDFTNILTDTLQFSSGGLLINSQHFNTYKCIQPSFYIKNIRPHSLRVTVAIILENV